MDIVATSVFYKNLNTQKFIVLNRGGARSSKSYSIAQLLGCKFLSEKNKKILILRKYLPSLRISTLKLFKDLISEWGVLNKIRQERINLSYFFDQNGNYLHFGSLDDPEKIKSTEWNYIWMEEATEFTHEDFKTLKLRMSAPTKDGFANQMFLSFNPVSETHWIHEKLLGRSTIQKSVPEKDVIDIHSSYKDNPFLEKPYLEMLKDLEKQDYNFYRIYTLGEWGTLTSAIYNNWDVVDDMPDSETYEDYYGIDFGFNSPMSLVRVRTPLQINKSKEFWSEELIYETGMTNQDLIARMRNLVPLNALIYADSAEPDRIREIQRAGFSRCRKAKKEVRDGIDIVKRFKWHILKDSNNLLKEVQSYSWKENRDGLMLDEPVKFMDHALDAIRYVIHTRFSRYMLGEVRVRFIA